MGADLVPELYYHSIPLANQSLLPLKVPTKHVVLLRQALHGVSSVESLLTDLVQRHRFDVQLTLGSLQLLSDQPQLVLDDPQALLGLPFFVLGPRPRRRSMLQVGPMLYKLLGQALYLSSEASLLEGQGGNLSLIRLRRPDRALDKANPPCQALHVSNHQPKKNKRLANNLKQ